MRRARGAELPLTVGPIAGTPGSGGPGRMGMRLALLGMVGLVLLVADPAAAQTASRKFVRGLAGMTTAVLEVPGNMYADTQTRGAAEGLPLGFAKGLGMIVPRTLVGVYEFVSAPFEAPSG